MVRIRTPPALRSEDSASRPTKSENGSLATSATIACSPHIGRGLLEQNPNVIAEISNEFDKLLGGHANEKTSSGSKRSDGGLNRPTMAKNRHPPRPNPDDA